MVNNGFHRFGNERFRRLDMRPLDAPISILAISKSILNFFANARSRPVGKDENVESFALI